MQEKQAFLCELENAVKNFDGEATAEVMSSAWRFLRACNFQILH